MWLHLLNMIEADTSSLFEWMCGRLFDRLINPPVKAGFADALSAVIVM